MIYYPVYDKNTDDFLGLLNSIHDLPYFKTYKHNVHLDKHPWIIKLEFEIRACIFPTILQLDLQKYSDEEQAYIREYLAVDLPMQDPTPNEDTSNAIDELESGGGERLADVKDMLNEQDNDNSILHPAWDICSVCSTKGTPFFIDDKHFCSRTCMEAYKRNPEMYNPPWFKPGMPLYASQEISPEEQKFEEIKNLATTFLLNQTERAISHCSGDNIPTYVVCSDFVHSCWTLAECFYGLADRKSKEGK